MKIFSYRGMYEVQEAEGQVITIPIGISKNESGETQLFPIDGILDSGCTGIVLPEAVARLIGIVSSDIEGSANAETAGGETATLETKINLQLRCEPSGETVSFEGVPASIMKSESVLIGGSILRHFDILMKNGQLALLALSDPSQRRP